MIPTTLRHWEITDEIPSRMPILDRWVERAAQDQPLSGVAVLNIQHQLGNQVPQTRALLKLGVSPRDLYWIEIPYTATPIVREALYGLGIPRENVVVSDFRLLDKYAPFQQARVLRFLRALLESPPERLLVLDDGSYMLEALASVRGRPPFVAIVEQTTRGLIKIEDSAALEHCSRGLRIINVARSRPKATLEPPFIGVSVTEALGRRIESAVRTEAKHRCLVLGYGAIGRQVATFLSDALGFAPGSIHVLDPAPDRMRQATADGFRTWDKREELRFDVVIGCSGRASFRVGDYVFLEDGALLASATSGTVELSREDFIELADSNLDDDISIERVGLDEDHVHSDLRFHFVDRNATFLNGGFPINFDGRVNCIPAHYIQPTPTMMCAAAVQAMSSTTPGLIDLDPDFCGWLDTEFRAELADEASLLS
jgi:S-adenosylhomocysteine hydrolase